MIIGFYLSLNLVEAKKWLLTKWSQIHLHLAVFVISAHRLERYR